MARFLIAVWPFSGHIHPNLAVAHALRARGHEVAVYSGPSACALAAADGFVCFPFEQVDGERADEIILAVGGAPADWRHPFRAKGLVREWILESVPAQIADLEAVFARWCPDVLLCDPAMWGPILVLHETHRIPVAILSYVAACMLPGRDGPIVGLPMARPRGWPARIFRALVRRVVQVFNFDVKRGASELRGRYGLAPLRTTVSEFAGTMSLYLMPSVPEFDYDRRDLPPTVHYVGPCTWDRPAGEAAPAWLDDLPRDLPIVYVTEGTTHAREPVVLRAALRGLADLPVRVIVTTGRHRDPASLGLGVIPPNARVEQWVPHTDLLPRVDVVVTTGGSGTVLAALQMGIPLVVVPSAWDQPENAWRVAESGAGLRLPLTGCTPDRMRAAVRQLLDDPSYRANAARLGDALARRGGAAEAAELLEGIAAHQPELSQVSR